jgi:hypothetical protein
LVGLYTTFMGVSQVGGQYFNSEQEQVYFYLGTHGGPLGLGTQTPHVGPGMPEEGPTLSCSGAQNF